MKKSFNKPKQHKLRTKYGYWVYRDGHCYWGISMPRNGEIGVEITKELYQWIKEENRK